MDGHRRAASCAIWGNHEALRWGLSALLKEGGVTVVGHTWADERAIEMARRKRPEVAVLDLDGCGSEASQVCRAIFEAELSTAVVLYTEGRDTEQLVASLDAGAHGLVCRQSPAADLVRAVRLAARGERYLDGTLTVALLERRRGDRFLSERETQVLQLLANGATTQQAALHLFLSPATIRSYAESAIGKFGAQNRVEAVAEALRRRLIA
jgi:DNA-binding NarL/FixJ family response regulator